MEPVLNGLLGRLVGDPRKDNTVVSWDFNSVNPIGPGIFNMFTRTGGGQICPPSETA